MRAFVVRLDDPTHADGPGAIVQIINHGEHLGMQWSAEPSRFVIWPDDSVYMLGLGAQIERTATGIRQIKAKAAI